MEVKGQREKTPWLKTQNGGDLFLAVKNLVLFPRWLLEVLADEGVTWQVSLVELPSECFESESNTSRLLGEKLGRCVWFSCWFVWWKQDLLRCFRSEETLAGAQVGRDVSVSVCSSIAFNYMEAQEN